MFDLSTVWVLMLFSIVAGLFWQIRKVAELARISAQHYCQKHALQLLSVAMATVRIRWQNGLIFVITFDLNYSPEGLTAKKGEITIINGKVDQIYHWG